MAEPYAPGFEAGPNELTWEDLRQIMESPNVQRALIDGSFLGAKVGLQPVTLSQEDERLLTEGGIRVVVIGETGGMPPKSIEQARSNERREALKRLCTFLSMFGQQFTQYMQIRSENPDNTYAENAKATLKALIAELELKSEHIQYIKEVLAELVGSEEAEVGEFVDLAIAS